jgi:hypothetical protein
VFELEQAGDEEARTLMVQSSVARMVKITVKPGCFLDLWWKLVDEQHEISKHEHLSCDPGKIKTEVVESAAEAGIRWMVEFDK